MAAKHKHGQNHYVVADSDPAKQGQTLSNTLKITNFCKYIKF